MSNNLLQKQLSSLSHGACFCGSRHVAGPEKQRVELREVQIITSQPCTPLTARSSEMNCRHAEAGVCKE